MIDFTKKSKSSKRTESCEIEKETFIINWEIITGKSSPPF